MNDKQLLDFLLVGICKMEENIVEMNSDVISNQMSVMQLLGDVSGIIGNLMSLRIAIEDKTETIIRKRPKIIKK